MRKAEFLSVLLVTAAGATSLALAEDGPGTIEKVMKTAISKSGLIGKVVNGQATEGQRAELVKLVQDLAGETPPIGDMSSWKAKTSALVTAAQAAVDGQPDAGAQLKQAANCKACHSVHRSE